MEHVKVTALGQTYSYQGKQYGPFQASEETPYLEVPLGVALASGAPIHGAELAQVQDEIQPEGADIQELLDANHSLKEELDEANRQLGAVRTESQFASEIAVGLGADLDKANTELESTQSDFIRYQNDLPGLKARVVELELGAAAEPEGKPTKAAKGGAK